MSLTPGTRLGPYEILSALGAGGMGEVYRANDTSLKRQVAIKVLPQAMAADPERLARFQREAEVLAALNHPNIAHIYGLERQEGREGQDSQLALVMELVEGPTLAEMLIGGLPLHDALNIARQLAEALEAAHEQGIIHRDLKPANIKVRDDGTVKVLDFGLAKALEPASGSGLQASGGMTQSPTITSPAMMTGAGVILGTAAYMSPEQASGKAVDKRADIWAFGVVLFELVTGKRLFDGETIAHTLADVLRRDLDFSKLPSDIPIALRDLLHRCLDRNVKTRLRDMGEARIVLDYSIAHPEAANLANTGNRVNVANPGKPWRRALPWAFASATGIAAVVTLTLWAPWRQTTPLLPVRFTIVPPAAQPLLVTNTDREIAISPDGSLVAYIASGNAVGGVGQLMVRAIDRLESEPLRGITGARAPFFSPDGKWIGYFAGVATAELRKVAVAGGPPIPLCRFVGNPRGASWGPNDTIVFATSDTTGLLSVSVSGGEPKVLTTPDLAHGEQDHWFPSVLPNGKAVLFTVVASGVLGNLTTSANAANQHLAVLDLKSGVQKALVRSGTQAEYIELSTRSRESGLVVYAADGSLLVVRFDPITLEVKSDPVPVVDQVATSGFGEANFVVARTGTLIYVPGGQTTAGGGVTRPLVWVDRRGREESIDLPPRAYYAVRLSPDGKRLALDVRDQDNDIWIWDLSRQTLDRRTFDASVDRLPVWTPDGGRIAFASQRDGADSLYWRPSDGTGSDERLTTSEARFHVPNSFSPDGKRLVFRDGTVAGNSGDGDLMMLLLDGKARPTPLVQTPFDERNGEISPDGRWLAYESNELGQFQIYVRPFPEVSSGRVQIGAGTKPAWRRDSRELFYVDANNILTAVPVQAATTFAAGTAVKLFEIRFSTTANGRFYDVSPDGQRFVVIKGSPANQDTNAAPASMVVVLNWFEELKTRVPTK